MIFLIFGFLMGYGITSEMNKVNMSCVKSDKSETVVYGPCSYKCNDEGKLVETCLK